MSSWPPTLVDWGTLTPQLRDGDPVCVVHGLVDTETAPVGIPICPHCHQAVTIARRDRRGVLKCFVGPAPARCSQGHPLVGGRVTVGWTPCMCPAAHPGPGGHRTWTCTACTELGRGHDVAELRWPPHLPESRSATTDR
jgi:hypothetical protein